MLLRVDLLNQQMSTSCWELEVVLLHLTGTSGIEKKIFT